MIGEIASFRNKNLNFFVIFHMGGLAPTRARSFVATGFAFLMRRLFSRHPASRAAPG